MQRLEDLLGIALFSRQGRAMVLTEAGQAMVRYAKRILALNGEAVAYVRGHESAGSVRLGMSVDFEHTWLPKAMARFGKTHPKIVVELRVDRNPRWNGPWTAENSILRSCSVPIPLRIVRRLGSAPMAWIASGSFYGRARRNCRCCCWSILASFGRPRSRP